MKFNIKKELNRNFEILGLLYICSHPEYIGKEHYINSTKEYNLDGEKLFKKMGGTWQRYIKTFQKNIYSPDFAQFFIEEDDSEQGIGFLFLIQFILTNYPNYVENISNVTNDELRLVIMRSAFDDMEFDALPTMPEIIELLKTSGLSEKFCWKVTLMLQSPKSYFEQLADIIQKNIPAYEQAVAAVSKQLENLLANFPDFEKYEYKIFSALKDGSIITPSLIYPGAEIMDTFGNAYFGLYLRDIYRMISESEASRSNLLPILKAMGDQSKFDILVLLKKKPMYNLELAEQLNLTAATVSHHMNVLLSHDLVIVEKYDGRVYYSLKTKTIKTMIQELQSMFNIDI